MCAMAMMHARLHGVVFAAADPKTGAAGSVVDLFGNWLAQSPHAAAQRRAGRTCGRPAARVFQRTARASCVPSASVTGRGGGDAAPIPTGEVIESPPPDEQRGRQMKTTLDRRCTRRRASSCVGDALRRAARAEVIGLRRRTRCQREAAPPAFCRQRRRAPGHAADRVADAAPSIAMACRGGYGMTRLLDAIDWKRIARSVSARHALGRLQRHDARCRWACSRTRGAPSLGRPDGLRRLRAR